MLERRIGAVCRAVAVKVAENNDRLNKQTQALSEDSAPEQKMVEHKEAGSADKVGIDGEALVNLPPELPIVIDEQAVEDILGVCIEYEQIIKQSLVFDFK